MKKIANYHLRCDESIEDQFLQAIQEFSEIIKEITKWKLGRGEYEKLLEELFDVDFMIYQLKLVLITRPADFEAWQREVDNKISRELGRHDL